MDAVGPIKAVLRKKLCEVPHTLAIMGEHANH